MNDKALSFLGLAARAGELKSGDDTVLKTVQTKKAQLVIVAGDASANTIKKFTDKTDFYSCPFRVAGTKADLGAAIGKESRTILSVTERGFAKKLIKLIDEEIN
ncbi:LSU ribosomal protein L7AE [Marinococcus luteus]|uniref:LSU ribosomal protein L7AE n=1 Tax=Marinococcus luteus TaxID=1122204 RepID=A0A1H2QEU3_9BACI|nr:ribosomal L7Ae/L30e/S12e/Gadd45 family protein [Marinococcus luteus]SDW04929.1 LSU ribosomal protein L7AE [Marinococcus luteus]